MSVYLVDRFESIAGLTDDFDIVFPASHRVAVARRSCRRPLERDENNRRFGADKHKQIATSQGISRDGRGRGRPASWRQA